MAQKFNIFVSMFGKAKQWFAGLRTKKVEQALPVEVKQVQFKRTTQQDIIDMAADAEACKRRLGMRSQYDRQLKQNWKHATYAERQLLKTRPVK